MVDRARIYLSLARVWFGAWRETATFVDRIESAGDQDRDLADGQAALTLAAVSVVEFLREAAGLKAGLAAPPELETLYWGQANAAAVNPLPRGGGTTQGVDVSTVVPGAWDVECAVRSIWPLGVPSAGTLDTFSLVGVPAAETILTLRVPKGDDLPTHALKVPAGLPTRPAVGDTWLDADDGYFPRAQRKLAAIGGHWEFATPFTSLVAARQGVAAAEPVGGIHEHDVTALSTEVGQADQPGFAALKRRVEVARSTLSGLGERASLASAALRRLVGADWDEGRIEPVADALSGLGAQVQSIVRAYDVLANTLATATLTSGVLDSAKAKASSVASERAKLQAGRLKTDLYGLLDDVVRARIGYPDGKLRQLRLLEVGFQQQWQFRKPWFAAHGLRLEAALADALAPHAETLGALRSGTVLAAAKQDFVLDEPVLALSAGRIVLAAEPKLATDTLLPGSAFVVKGDRYALVVVTAVERPPHGAPRLRVLPLRVSLVPGSAAVPGSPGIVGVRGQVVRHTSSVSLTTTRLRRGRSRSEPALDGVIEQAVHLWSVLTLFHGAETAKTAGWGAGFPAAIPLDRWIPAELSSDGGVLRLLVKQADVEDLPWQDPYEATRSVLVRPGELILVRAQDERGMWWQSVGEARKVTVMSAKRAAMEPGSLAADAPLCCGGVGDTHVVEIEGLRFPEPVLQDSFCLGRSFQGLGARSLAARELLPRELDPGVEPWPTHSEAGAPTRAVNRAPELQFALELLDRLMGVGP